MPLIALGLAGLFVVYALIGVVRNYSPVPFWDMWDGAVGFVLRAHHDGLASWVAPHGEHRIILTRLFLYADLAWLGGTGVLPLTANLLANAAIAWIFCRTVALSGAAAPKASRQALWAVCIGITFFWSQRENFTWAFQTQFFLAQLLPLSSFYLAGRAATTNRPTVTAIAATICAVLALGSMANGVLTLPLLLVLGTCVGLGRIWIASNAFLTIVVVLAIAGTFEGGQTHVSLLSVLVTNPLDVGRFALRYLGAGLWFASGMKAWATSAAEVAGCLLLVATALTLPTAWRSRRAVPLRLAMLATTTYVIATAFITALGRLPYGMDGALTSRYTGMANMGWVALLVAIYPSARCLQRARLAPLLAIAILIGLMPWQLHAKRNQTGTIYDRRVAALALAAQMRDAPAIGVVYPADRMGYALETAAAARAAGLHVFGSEALAQAPGWLGKHLPAADCAKGTEATRALGDGSSDRRIDGHLKQPFSHSSVPLALVVDEHDTIVGWALVRPKAAREHGDTVPGAPFSGYIRDPRTRDPQWPITALRICQSPSGAPLTHSE